jgi:hypothetical protein
MKISVKTNSGNHDIGTITIEDASTIAFDYWSANDLGGELFNAYRDLFHGDDFLKHLSMYLDKSDIDVLTELEEIKRIGN